MSGLMTYDITLDEKDFEKISQIVHRHCGINLHSGKKELVRARLAKLIRIGGFKSFTEYMSFIDNDNTGKEFSVLIDNLSTNLTSFFREQKHFDFLRSDFLPQMVKSKQLSGSNRIRCWSAGCSSGEEPYSLAILLHDFFQNLPGWDVKILATDISTRMLDRAREGIYDKQRIEPVSQGLRTRYLRRNNDQATARYEVSDTLKSMITFKYLNLMEEWPFRGPMDFIFCRNVMIYFDKPTQQRLVGRYHDMLSQGGVLFTGHSESLTGIDHKFKYVQPTIYRK